MYRGLNPFCPEDDFTYMAQCNNKLLYLKPQRSAPPVLGDLPEIGIFQEALSAYKKLTKIPSKENESVPSSSAKASETEKASKNGKPDDYEDSDENKIGIIINSFRNQSAPIPVLVTRSQSRSVFEPAESAQATVSQSTELFSDLSLSEPPNFDFTSTIYEESDLSKKTQSQKSKPSERRDSGHSEHEYRKHGSPSTYIESDLPKAPSVKSKLPDKRDSDHEYRKYSSRRKHDDDYLSDGPSRSKRHEKESSSRHKKHKVSCRSRRNSDSGESSSRRSKDKYSRELEEYQRSRRIKREVLSSSDSSESSYKHRRHKRSRSRDIVRSSKKSSSSSKRRHSDSDSEIEVLPKSRSEPNTDSAKEVKRKQESPKYESPKYEAPKNEAPKYAESVMDDYDDIELIPGVFGGSEAFYCQVCQLNLNGIACYENHMAGKKHKKALNAQLLRPEAVLRQVIQTGQPNVAKVSSGLQSMTKNAKMKPVNDIAKIQSTLDNYYENPIPGLDYIYEIISDNPTDGINYYCELCEAPCKPQSLLSHLIGFKHYLNFLKIIDRDFYEEVKDRSRKSINNKVKKRLDYLLQRHGRKRIQVVMANVDARGFPVLGPDYEAGPSRLPPPSRQQDIMAMAASCIDDYGDYYCVTCDAHMNNEQMFHAHMVGKRHLKNEKKVHSGVPSTSATLGKGQVKAPPNTPSVLEQMLQDYPVPIVGLNFMRETRNPNGEYYTCFICGCCATSDVIDHIISMKHRIKYLERVNESGNIPNDIGSIRVLEVSTQVREGLVEDLCREIEAKHGRGRVEVYI